jgi:PAS domain S-box-containing protein
MSPLKPLSFHPEQFFELALDLVCVADAQGRFLHVNPAFTELLGWSREELLGSLASAILHPDDVESQRREVEALGRGGPRSFENRYRCSDGTYRQLSWSARAELASGRIYAVARDVTAHRAIEGSLQQIFDASPAGLLLVTAQGAIAMANPMVAELLGYEVDELLGLPVEVLLPAAQRSAHVARRAFAGSPRRMAPGRRVMAARKDGSEVPIEIRLSSIDGLGEPLTLAAVSDQRQQRALEESLEAARNVAEEASRAKSEFLANMSHEIRTPLTAILGFADVLCEMNDAGSAEQRLQILDTIKNAGVHLLTVINDILDLSKIEADKMTVERVETPLVAVLREIEGLMRPRASGKGVTVETVLATPVPDRIVSDPTRLRQILMNLAGNAVKFTEAGAVTLRAGVTGDAALAKLVIDVVDTGPGMTREQADRLFCAFGQADATVTRKHGGTGLGLTICRRLAGLMGGSVELVATEPGVGSTFRVELPLEPIPGAQLLASLGEPSARRVEVPVASARVVGRVLLAEDGVDNQRLISLHLRKAGATVEVADNGVIALAMIDRAEAEGRPYDLLLTDIQMPEMDGYTLARTLRARGSGLSIVALTAHAMAEDRERCTAAGCDDYAAKPIDKATLLATCAAWVGRRRSGGRGSRAA